MNRMQLQNFLSNALAVRLNAVVPDYFHIEIVGREFRLLHNKESEFWLYIDDLWEGSSDKENIETFTSSVINSTQDAVTLSTKEIWPPDTTLQNMLPMSQFSWFNDQLNLWFEVNGEVVLRLEPIDFTGLFNE
jgi:hypothetical protein